MKGESSSILPLVSISQGLPKSRLRDAHSDTIIRQDHVTTYKYPTFDHGDVMEDVM